MKIYGHVINKRWLEHYKLETYKTWKLRDERERDILQFENSVCFTFVHWSLIYIRLLGNILIKLLTNELVEEKCGHPLGHPLIYNTMDNNLKI